MTNDDEDLFLGEQIYTKGLKGLKTVYVAHIFNHSLDISSASFLVLLLKKYKVT